MEHVFLQQVPGQPVGEGLEGHAEPSDPVGQGGQGQRDALAGGDLRQAIQRQVVREFGNGHPDQKVHRGQATVDDGGRHRGRHDRRAVLAGILGADVPVHGEFGRLDVELLADVLADLDQRAAVLTTAAGFRFVAVFDARQVGG